METINVNLNNLTNEERTQLLNLIEKSNKVDDEFKVGDTYYYIDDEGIIDMATWDNNGIDNDRKSLGNRFETEEKAKFEKERRVVIAELENFAKKHNECEINWKNNKQSKWSICFNYMCNKILAFNNTGIIPIKHNDIYFTSSTIVQQAIKEIGEERIKKYYLRMED